MLVAGSIDLNLAMQGLARSRPVFHSEADFQFAFAQHLADVGDVEVRLEVRLVASVAEYVDIVCWGPYGRTLIELKYPTASWIGPDRAGEHFTVRNHSAYDLSRRYFIHDIARLERFTTASSAVDGLAIMLTNEPGLWSPPRATRTRDYAFRIHEGQELVGQRVWGHGDRPDLDENLRGRYRMTWRDYSDMTGPRGVFRWCAAAVGRDVIEPS